MRLLYILDGKKPKVVRNTFEWAKGMNHETKKVASDVIDGIHVSTVFLGIDHNYSRSGPPILFETMIFGGEHDGYQERYATWEQAEAGHKEAVKMVNAKNN